MCADRASILLRHLEEVTVQEEDGGEHERGGYEYRVRDEELQLEHREAREQRGLPKDQLAHLVRAWVWVWVWVWVGFGFGFGFGVRVGVRVRVGLRRRVGVS